MSSDNERTMHRILWLLIAAMALVICIEKANCQVVATFHPQFSEKHTTSWDMCVSNRLSANISIGMADIYRVTAGRMNVLNAVSRAYEFRHRKRAKWLRAINITASVTALLQATPAIQIGELPLNLIAPLVSAGSQLALPVIEGNQRQDFEVGVYWDATRTLAAGESACAMVMSLKVKDAQSFLVVMSEDFPPSGPALGAIFPSPPAVEVAGPLLREPLIPLADSAATCVVRPSSVESEDGCEAWYA